MMVSGSQQVEHRDLKGQRDKLVQQDQQVPKVQREQMQFMTQIKQ
jgi:hypothetical protein